MGLNQLIIGVILMTAPKKSAEKVLQDCLRILKSESCEVSLKWLSENKFSSFMLRNEKAAETISISNYMIQKMLITRNDKPNELLALLVDYHKKNPLKSYEYARLIKHFSQWDYEFEYLYLVALDQQKDDISLYLRVRETVARSQFNTAKKEMLSGITAELKEWAALAKYIFRQTEKEDVVDQFTTVVKHHYLQVKKSQTECINGAEFFKICQIINASYLKGRKEGRSGSKEERKSGKEEGRTMVSVFDQSLLSGLSSQDKQLIRVLSYKDKNIARMLQEKHTKMVHLIAEEVDKLRRDINHEKERYVEVVEQKNTLMRLMERIKECALNFIVDRSEFNEFELLQLLDNYNKKHNPRASDVARTTDVIKNRRLIEIIERQELEDD